MVAKTATVLASLATCYLVLVFGNLPWPGSALVAVILGFAVAAVGFNVQHDASHGSFSSHRALNRALAFTLDLVGGSSYVWRFKHNILHHTYPNVSGMDADIAPGPFLRFAPAQPWRRWHRFQAIYVWALYALLPVKWQFIDDVQEVACGRIGPQPFPRPGALELIGLIVGKLAFFTWALAIPLLFHPVGVVLTHYAIAFATLGVTMAVTFQLAHCVSGARFPEPSADGRIELGWAEHQVQTTLNFSRNNRFLTWYLGGLNYQIEHHLFPRICHVHYPAISHIVEETCRRHGLPYHTQDTALAAIAAHVRLVHRLGRGTDRPVTA
jgi:linoleoyl-CoA desaturase